MNTTLRPCLILLIALMLSTVSKGQFLDNPVIAHRGAWKKDKLPQNSIASLKKAIELGCAATEFDVHLTKDNILVVNHDNDFYGLDIATSSYAQLLERKHPNGESIPTAAEYIREGMKQQQTKLVFELKNSALGPERTLEAASLSVQLVKELGAEEWVEYILFGYDAARRIISLAPDAQVSYLLGDVSPEKAKADGFFGLDYNFRIYRENPDWIREAKALGLIINVWTVNKAEDMIDFLGQQVDYITTDEPELLFELLRERSGGLDK